MTGAWIEAAAAAAAVDIEGCGGLGVKPCSEVRRVGSDEDAAKKEDAEAVDDNKGDDADAGNIEAPEVAKCEAAAAAEMGARGTAGEGVFKVAEAAAADDR